MELTQLVKHALARSPSSARLIPEHAWPSVDVLAAPAAQARLADVIDELDESNEASSWTRAFLKRLVSSLESQSDEVSSMAFC